MTDAKLANGSLEKVKGGLVLKLAQDCYITVGEVKIYLDEIDVSGTKGGKKIVGLRFIGPRETIIRRHDR